MHLGANSGIKTILYEVFPDQSFAGETFQIPTVDPNGHFLKRLFYCMKNFKYQLKRSGTIGFQGIYTARKDEVIIAPPTIAGGAFY